MDIQGFWDAVLKQDARKIEKYFWDDAYINWHCTNEHFNVKEYIKANCEYPGDWEGEIQRVEQAGDVSIVVVHVYNQDKSLSFHVVSFLRIRDDKIAVPICISKRQSGAAPSSPQYSSIAVILSSSTPIKETT